MSVDFNASFSGSAETFGARMTETPASMTASMKETGGGSTSNYEALRNKPKINGHELIGDMTPAQLGITDDRHHTHKQAQAAKVWTIVTVAFEAAAKREAPTSGEKLSVLLGKVLKFFSDLKTVAFSGSYKDLSDKPTIPSAAADVGAIPATEKGAAGGVAELDSGGKVPANQLPSYVDDVVDAYIRTGATALGADWLSKTSGGAALTPESDKIYVILSEGEYQNKTYRWSGTTYAVIGNDLAIGETASTAYRGDRGKTAYDHSQSAHAPADAEKNVQSDWNETDGNSDAFIKNKPAIPKAVTKTVQTLSDAASKSFTVTGYILSVILIDSVTKEQVIGDVSFENATASANGKVTVTLAAAPSNPILVVITSIAL